MPWWVFVVGYVLGVPVGLWWMGRFFIDPRDWSEANILAAWELWLFFGLIWPVVLPLFAVMWLLKLTLGGMVTRCMLAGQRTARREAQKRSGTGTPTGDTR